MLKELMMKYNKGDEEYEVTFNGFIVKNDYENDFEFNELVSVINDDGDDVIDFLEEDEYDNIIAECEEYAIDKFCDKEEDYDDYDDDYDDYDDYNDDYEEEYDY